MYIYTGMYMFFLYKYVTVYIMYFDRDRLWYTKRLGGQKFKFKFQILKCDIFGTINCYLVKKISTYVGFKFEHLYTEIFL